MNIYLEFVKKAFQQRFIYRANSLVLIMGSLVKMFIQISVWKALLGPLKIVKGVSFPDMVSFVILNLVVNSLVSSNIANRLAEKVQDGSIAVDLLKPVSLKGYLVAEQLGFNIFQTLFSTLPACLIGMIFFKFTFPVRLVNLLLFMVSIAFGIILMYYINYILGLLSFWFKTSFYVNWYISAFFELFAGTIVPLWFYPSWLLMISKVLPFHLIAFQPISIYLGKLSLNQAMNMIFAQFIWIMLLIVLESFVWKKAQKVIIVQGG